MFLIYYSITTCMDTYFYVTAAAHELNASSATLMALELQHKVLVFVFGELLKDIQQGSNQRLYK